MWDDERLLVAIMAAYRCKACGAGLDARPERCPLCGSEPAVPKTTKAPSEPVENVSDYQARLRKLRRELEALRDDGAEAV